LWGKSKTLQRWDHEGKCCIPPALIAKLAASISDEALTGRELEVLSLLARGKSNKEIGADSSVCRKLPSPPGLLQSLFSVRMDNNKAEREVALQ
jgi:hypothetical protein